MTLGGLAHGRRKGLHCGGQPSGQARGGLGSVGGDAVSFHRFDSLN